MRRISKQYICLIIVLLIVITTCLSYVHVFERVNTEKSGPDKHAVVQQNNTHVTSDAAVSLYEGYYVYFYSGVLNESIMDMKPIKFNSLYKNPCWVGSSLNGPLNDNKLHCLPYFYLVGVKKSGTGDLYTKIALHPEVTYGDKEKSWFARTRWNYVTGYKRKTIPKILGSEVDHRSVGFYVKLFDKAAIQIEAHPSNDPTTRYKMISVDASPSSLFAHGKWTELPGNKGLVEPRFTNFHYINHLTPNSKIIIIIRDPVTRLYSDFLHTTNGYDKKSMSAKTFHDHATRLIGAYRDCFNRWSMRRCIYNDTLRLDLMQRGVLLADSFTCGFLAFYMKEMLAVFDRDRIHIVLTMEYDRDTKNVLNNTYKFLNLSPLSDSQLEAIAKKRRQNTRNTQKLKVGPMLDHTRDMLYDFYKPYNKDMADLMKDSRYLFPKDAK